MNLKFEAPQGTYVRVPAEISSVLVLIYCFEQNSKWIRLLNNLFQYHYPIEIVGIFSQHFAIPFYITNPQATLHPWPYINYKIKLHLGFGHIRNLNPSSNTKVLILLPAIFLNCIYEGLYKRTQRYLFIDYSWLPNIWNWMEIERCVDTGMNPFFHTKSWEHIILSSIF